MLFAVVAALSAAKAIKSARDFPKSRFTIARVCVYLKPNSLNVHVSPTSLIFIKGKFCAELTEFFFIRRNKKVPGIRFDVCKGAAEIQFKPQDIPLWNRMAP